MPELGPDSTSPSSSSGPVAAYELVDSFRTVETLGGVSSRDVQEGIFRAVPSGITFPARVPIPAGATDTALLLAKLGAIAAARSGYIGQALLIPGVVGMYAVQQFDASNQQMDVWVVTVSSTSGLTTTTIEQPFRDFYPELQAKVPPVRAALDQLEATGRQG